MTTKETKETKKEFWNVWQCENPSCVKPNVANCILCSTCSIKSYCGPKCRNEDKSSHSNVCGIVPLKMRNWVKKLRTYVALLQNDEERTSAILEDVYSEYKDNGKRGAVVVDLGQQKIETNVIMPMNSSSSSLTIEQTENKKKKEKSIIKDKHSFVWHYVSADNEAFVKEPRYAKLVHLMKNYNPAKEFVLLVICIDHLTNKHCFIESVVGGTPP
jgi:hypothetical protein